MGLAGLAILFAVAVAVGGPGTSMDPMSGSPGSGALTAMGWLVCGVPATVLVFVGLRMTSG